MSTLKSVKTRNDYEPSGEWAEVELMAVAIGLALVALGITAWVGSLS